MKERAQIPVTLPVQGALRSFWMDDYESAKRERSVALEEQNEKKKQTQQEIPSAADIVIVGSGISGAAVAWELIFGEGKDGKRKRDGEKIVMLEARGVCEGATGRNGGHTKAASYRSFSHHARTHGLSTAVQIARFEYANIHAVHTLARTHGIACDSWVGETVDIFYDAKEWEMARTGVEELWRGFAAESEAKREGGEKEGDEEDGNGNGEWKGEEKGKEEKEVGGVQWYEFFSADEAREKFQIAGAREVLGALRYTAGSINAYKFVRGVLDLCLRESEGNGGFKIFEGTAVIGVERAAAAMVEGEKGGGGGGGKKYAYSIKTADGNTIHANHVVLATNGYTGFLRPEFQGVIVPLRGQVTGQKFVVRATTTTEGGEDSKKREDKKKEEEKAQVRNRTYSLIYANGFDYLVPFPTNPSTNPNPEGTPPQTYILGGGLTHTPSHGLSEFGETNDRILNPSISTYLHRCLQDVFISPVQVQVQAQVQNEWTGIMGYSADGMPFVGRLDSDPDPDPDTEAEKRGLYITASFQGHGMVLCWGCAREVVVRGIRKRRGGGLGLELDDTDIDRKNETKKKSGFPEVYRMRKERLRREFEGFVG
ncbi:hypothetical protein ACMFMG_006143 [Clarireedia jacksonii]